MVHLRGFRDKLGSVRVEGQAFGPREAPRAWVFPVTRASCRRRKGPSRGVSSSSLLLPGREGHTIWEGAMLWCGAHRDSQHIHQPWSSSWGRTWRPSLHPSSRWKPEVKEPLLCPSICSTPRLHRLCEPPTIPKASRCPPCSLSLSDPLLTLLLYLLSLVLQRYYLKGLRFSEF